MAIESLAPEHIRSISPYVPGKPISELAREHGLCEKSIIKLASNENPLGLGPGARAAMAAAMGKLARYPDGNGFDLKSVISKRLGVDARAIVLGNGSNDLLELVARTFLGQGVSGVHAQYAFAVYPLAIRSMGARAIEVPARGYGHDLAAMADAIAEDTRVVFIANPNNPTGSFLPGKLIEAFLSCISQSVIVVLDEAYCEYLPATLRYDSIAWLKHFPNLVITRTFSKIHGLAGLRVGYALASSPVVDLMNRVRQPFNVNSLAQAAAVGAFEDDVFVRKSHELNLAGLSQVIAGLDALNLRHLPSCGNFVTFHVCDASGVNLRLLERGVIVRPLASYGMPEFLRVTIGLPEENEHFLAALAQSLKG